MKIQICLSLKLSPPGIKQLEGRSALQTGKFTKSGYLEACTVYSNKFQEPYSVLYCIQAYLGCNHSEYFLEVCSALGPYQVIWPAGLWGARLYDSSLNYPYGILDSVFSQSTLNLLTHMAEFDFLAHPSSPPRGPTPAQRRPAPTVRTFPLRRSSTILLSLSELLVYYLVSAASPVYILEANLAPRTLNPQLEIRFEATCDATVPGCSTLTFPIRE